MGDEDLTVSVNETATYFKLIREHTMAPNLWKERKINKTVSNISLSQSCAVAKSEILWQLATG